MCKNITPFHNLGVAIRAYPFPFFGLWLCVLIAGIVLAPIRMERSEDVIDTWLPLGGQARYARNFVRNGWKLQSYTTETPIEAQLDRLGIKHEDDAFFKSTRDYYVIWGADKNWDYEEGSSGASIKSKEHYKEWYDFNKLLWTRDYTIDGKTQKFGDVCAPTFATNSWSTGEGLMNNPNCADPSVDPLNLACGGTWLEGGWGPGKFDTILTQMQFGGAEGSAGRLWDSFAKDFPDDPNQAGYTPALKLHHDWHSVFVVGRFGPILAAQMAAASVPACANDGAVSCVRQPNAVSGVYSKHNFVQNCKTFVGSLSAKALLLFNLDLTLNEQVTLCSNLLVYSSFRGSSEFVNGCAPGDFTLCIQDSVTTLYGSLFQEPFVEQVYEAYPNLPTESMFTDNNIDNKTFFDIIDTHCNMNSYLTSSNYKYIRSSKYVAEPAQLARRLQIRAGNCTLKHPDPALLRQMYYSLVYTDQIKGMEALYNENLQKVQTCTDYGDVALYNGTLFVLRSQKQTLNNMIAAATGNQAAINQLTAQLTAVTAFETGFLANLVVMGYDFDSSDFQTKLGQLGMACGAVMPDILDGTAGADVTAGAAGLGAASGLFLTWYKYTMYWDCGDYTDEAINQAMGIRKEILSQVTEQVNKFNDNSTYLRAAILSSDLESSSYDNLYKSNIMIALIAIALFMVVCVILHWKVASVALSGVWLILFCVIATFGYMPPPYTPSAFQFLPYLCLGIGVDDLFVVLHHYYDEDNIPKTLHHAGSVITMTSSVNLLIFISLYIISPVPDFRIFTTAASIAIILLYFNVLFGIMPLLAIWERCTGKQTEDEKEVRPTDTFHASQFEDVDVDPKHALSAHAKSNYLAFKNALEPFKCIGTPIFIVLGFIVCTVLAFMKIEGVGFEKMDFGLQLSELVYKDNNDHTFRSIMILERFPLYAISCGAGKTWGTSDSNGALFDDYAPTFLEFFNGFNGSTINGSTINPDSVPDSSFSTSNFVSRMTNNGPMPYPHYTNQAKTFPNFPSGWLLWEDVNQLAWTNLTFPEATMFLRPPAPAGSGIVPGRDITEAIRNVYNHLDKYKDIGAFCSSNILEVYERYLDVEDVLNMGFIFAAIIVFVVGMCVIQDVGAVLILTLVDVATAYQLWGFYGFATLRINSFLTMCIMLGAAFTVQYTAHINRRYVLSDAPTRWYRIVDALSTYTGPIAWGGATTALAVSAAAFMPAKYFRLYFFYAFIIMVGFGLFNGLCVQSAMLVLIPINCETAKIPMFGEDDTPERRYSNEETRLGEDLKKVQLELAVTEFDTPKRGADKGTRDQIREVE